MKKFKYRFILLFLLTASCKTLVLNHTSSNAQIDNSITANSIDSIIVPYRNELNKSMNEIIGFADSNFISAAPNSSLSHLIADIVYEYGIEFLQSKNVAVTKQNCFSLLNFGGLRRPINRGDITRGLIYELMPFDNTIVVVEISYSKVVEMIDYLKQKNGQPISNLQVWLNENNKFQVGDSMSKLDSYYVVTSDYLAGGGDQMNFFLNPIQTIETGSLLRDEIISYIERVDTLKYKAVEQRIILAE